MNLGIYLSSLSQQDQLEQIAEAINSGISNKKLSDASVFYDNVAHNPYNIKCGIFNSTDLWNFSGKLITTSLQSTIKSLNIINKIDIYYYYGWEQKISPLALLSLIGKGIKIISKNKEHDDELFRKTGHRSLFISTSFSEVVEKIG